MDDERLPTDLWVQAHIRRCSIEGIPATVPRRGERRGGTVLLKLNQLEQGCRVLTQSRDLEGRLAWLPALNGKLVPEAEADEYSVYYLCDTDYAANGTAGFFEKLSEEGGVGVPEFLSTHPSPENRVEDINALAEDLGCSLEPFAGAQWTAFQDSLP